MEQMASYWQGTKSMERIIAEITIADGARHKDTVFFNQWPHSKYLAIVGAHAN